MNIAVVHYHLNRGGVTQVIINHLAALGAVSDQHEPARVAVFFGGRRQGWPADLTANLPNVHVTLHEIPALEYDQDAQQATDELAESLLAAFRAAGFRPDDTIVHIHNHALGKNASLPGAVARLASEGYAQLLQIHDFAEDFRPENYAHLVRAISPADPSRLSAKLYWQSTSIHYAVLNGRDRDILQSAGVAPQQLHTLPNPVAGITSKPSRTDARKKLKETCGISRGDNYVLYPVRAIRRKNLGEILLWAAVCGAPNHIGVTLAPLNPQERPSYEFWQRLAERLRLPVHLETGAEGRLQFGENLVAADCAITTSVAEGFGMVFLETWLAGLPLAGRDLPEISGDFVNSGVELPGMASSLNVPLDWVGKDAFAGDLIDVYRQVATRYGRPETDRSILHDEVSELCRDSLLDFGRCSARLQALIVEQVSSCEGRRRRLIELNSSIYDALISDRAAQADLLGRNAEVVRNEYSLISSGKYLADLYHTVFSSSREEPHVIEHGSEILNSFLRLNRLHPIRIQ